MHKAVKEMTEAFMRSGGEPRSLEGRLTPFEKYNEFVGLRAAVETKRKHTAV